jgi:hypothetical protein
MLIVIINFYTSNYLIHKLSLMIYLKKGNDKAKEAHNTTNFS